MRTTINLDDDVEPAIRQLAHDRGQAVGKVVSELVRRALAPSQKSRAKSRNGFPLFDSARGTRAVTSADVKRALEDYP